MKKPNFWTMRAALTPTRVLMGLVCGVALTVLPGIQSCATTCDDVDAQGNPIKVDCIECSTPPVQCAGNVWYLPPGSECLEAQRPLSPDGTACDLSSSGDGVCNAGVCEGRPVILAGSGSTTWSAPTNPPGGGTSGTTGGCSVFVPTLNNTLFFDVLIQLDVDSDGATNFTTAWTVNLANPLLGVLSNAAELGALDINAVATNATGGPIHSSLTAAATGQFVGNYYAGPNGPLELLTPGEITAGAATLTPTAAGVGSIVNVNWDGAFTLALTLGGGTTPLFTLDGSNCDFSVPGAGVDLPVEDCTFDLDCEDPATECLVGSCLGTGLCAAEVPGNDGGSCASGFGSGDGTCSAGSCVCTSDLDCGDPTTACLVAPPGACDLGTGLCAAEVPGNDGASCASGSGSGEGTCSAGSCDSNDACTVDGDCPDPGTADDCQIALCDTGVTPYVCGAANAAAGTTCSPPVGGTCDNVGVCEIPPSCNFVQTGSDATPQTQTVAVGCAWNVFSSDQLAFPWELSVSVPTAITGGGVFTADFDGQAFFSESHLDILQSVLIGGVAAMEIEDLAATVQVRSGAAGPPVTLGPDLTFLQSTCLFTETACDKANDLPDNGNTDCLPIISLNSCRTLLTVPTSTDLSTCLSLDPPSCAPGPACTKSWQHVLNGFCVTGDLFLPLAADSGTFTADASGEVLFGWADQGVPGLVTCPSAAPRCQESFMPNGSYDLPLAGFSNPTPPIGIRTGYSGLSVAYQCAMGEQGGICSATFQGCLVDPDCPGVETCDAATDVIMPTPDANLISCPIN